jgi:outer membrane murein-binding lipoprotein Lpp
MAKTIDQMSKALEKLIAKVDKLEIENKDLKEQKNKDPNKKTIQQAKDN